MWSKAKEADGELVGCEVAETTYRFAKQDLRLIVRRQAKAAGEQLSFDDLGAWRFFALITNVPRRSLRPPTSTTIIAFAAARPKRRSASSKRTSVNHAPLQSFPANWLWWLASALAYNVARWIRVLALPEPFRTCRGKRLRNSYFNVPARVVRSGRRLHLRLPRAYRHAAAFIAALKSLRALYA